MRFIRHLLFICDREHYAPDIHRSRLTLHEQPFTHGSQRLSNRNASGENPGKMIEFEGGDQGAIN
jgi:hypothetical protein